MLTNKAGITKRKKRVVAVIKSISMNGCHCRTEKEHGVRQVKSSRKGKGRIIGWGLPGLGLLFIPKCPLCVAAYVSMFTGLGLNYSEARWLRYGMIILCSASILLFMLHALKLFNKKSAQST